MECTGTGSSVAADHHRYVLQQPVLVVHQPVLRPAFACAAKSLAGRSRGAVFCGFLTCLGSALYLAIRGLPWHSTCRPFRTSWLLPVPPLATLAYPALIADGRSEAGCWASSPRFMFGAILSSFNSALNSRVHACYTLGPAPSVRSTRPLATRKCGKRRQARTAPVLLARIATA